MPSITGTLTASGDSAVLISVASNEALQVWGLQFYMSNTAAVVTVKTGSTAKFTCVGNATTFTTIEPAVSSKEPLFQGELGEDLVINLSEGNVLRYNIQYVKK